MRKVYVLLVFALLCFQQLGAQVLLQQSFDGAALPEGWRQDLDDGNTKGWIPLQSSSHSISNPFSGSHFVEFESYLTKSMLGARLISPEVNIPTKEFFLEFYSVVTSGSKGLHVDISRDFGATWVEDVLFIDKAEAETDWVKHTVDISSYLPCEHFRVRFRAVSSYGSGKCCIAVDDVKIYKPENMAFGMATTLQSNTSIVSVGQTAAEVIAVKVNCTGALNPLLVNSINFNTAATTNCADITKASVYYTGSSSSFSTENLVGHIDNPNADFVINANQQLIEGDNYFWLAYDISSTAVEGNGIDAICNSIIVDNILKTPDVTNPDGSRVIKNILSMLSGTKTVKVVNNLM
ncbi:MAG: hypothetical protein JXA53_04015, partial [Bacteroidales bacterium]|nr:hypothetical protein [Bacteroidales bacterium]